MERILELGASSLPALARLPSDTFARAFLRACSLVSTSWSDISREFLLRDPHVSGGRRAGHFLARVREYRSESRVASLWMTGTTIAETFTAIVLHSCPNVRRLCWTSGDHRELINPPRPPGFLAASLTTCRDLK